MNGTRRRRPVCQVVCHRGDVEVTAKSTVVGSGGDDGNGMFHGPHHPPRRHYTQSESPPSRSRSLRPSSQRCTHARTNVTITRHTPYTRTRCIRTVSPVATAAWCHTHTHTETTTDCLDVPVRRSVDKIIFTAIIRAYSVFVYPLVRVPLLSKEKKNYYYYCTLSLSTSGVRRTRIMLFYYQCILHTRVVRTYRTNTIENFFSFVKKYFCRRISLFKRYNSPKLGRFVFRAYIYNLTKRFRVV